MLKKGLILMGIFGCGISAIALADSVTLNEGEALRGLVVEEHEDRIVLSTSDGERELMRSDITEIAYDDPEYSFLNLAREMERGKKWEQALAYYEKALEINPELTEAQQAMLGIRSKVWAKVAVGPTAEVEKRQDMQEAWRANIDLDEVARKAKQTNAQLLWNRMGLSLFADEEWSRVNKTKSSSEIKEALEKGDLLTAIDGQSLRFMNSDLVIKHLLEPRYSHAIMQFQREVTLPKNEMNSIKKLGMQVSQTYSGLTLKSVRKQSIAEEQGLKDDDLIVAVNGIRTRYLSARKAIKLMEDHKEPQITLMIQRSARVTRK